MMSNLPWRLLGVLLLAVCVVLYEPAGETILHRLLLPLGMAAAAWLMVQNLAAVAFGTALLAAIHGNPGSTDPITGVAYPAVAATAGLVLTIILVRRFRARVRDTHDARWQRRRAGSRPSGSTNDQGTSP